MPCSQPVMIATARTMLTDFGDRLRLARLRRNFTVDTVAVRAGISRATLYRAERGDPAAALGTYLRILQVLGLDQDLALVARDDELGRRLQDLDLPARRRASTPRRAVPEPGRGPS